MNSTLDRRQFLERSTAIGASAVALNAFPSLLASESPNDKVIVGIMGVHGRGMDHIQGYLAQPNAEIAYICDVDSEVREKAIAAVAKKQARAPKGVGDFREILDDKSVDALSIAAPNHWHAPATILACAAGKHVYVEKPGSHNAHESELMVEAARKHQRVVQMGNQRRSWPWVIEAMERLHAGEIGRVLFARSWYNADRKSIGQGKPAPVPGRLDFQLWQGPAPDRTYIDNLVHYNWHWRWNWGGGELANNGIHALDIARWGLGVDHPVRVAAIGGRYHFHDDQETPDTVNVNFDFGDRGASWECHSCHPRGFEGEGFGINFYGDNGSLVIAGNKCRVYDMKQKLVREVDGKAGDAVHFANFLGCIRDGKRPNSDIGECQKSTMLCHLGNIAWRTGRSLNIDRETGKIQADHDAMKLWRREYRKGWAPKV